MPIAGNVAEKRGETMAEAAGWRIDPNGQHEMRYWDGVQWTNNVSDNGVASLDQYDPSLVPPPPAHATPPPAAPSSESARSVSFKLVCYDRKGNEVYSAPYQSADMAMQFANANPEFKLKKTVGGVLLRGAFHEPYVRWRTATIFKLENGTSSEYHTMSQR
jgi:hypothetical protein